MVEAVTKQQAMDLIGELEAIKTINAPEGYLLQAGLAKLRAFIESQPSAPRAEAVALSDLDALAKVYASSYASPHHITFTVEGLRNLVAAIAQGADEGERNGD